MNRRTLLSVIAVLALALGACDAATDTDEPAADEASPTPEEAQLDEDVDEAALERLLAAVENTKNEGTARFVISFGAAEDGTAGTGEGADAGTADTDTGATDDTDDTDTGATDDTDTGATDDTDDTDTGATDDTDTGAGTGGTDDDAGTTTDDTGTDDGTGTQDSTDDGDDHAGGTTDQHSDATTEQQAALVVEGEVDFDADQRKLQFQGPQGQLTAIIDGDELYVQIPAAEEGEWARIQLDQLAGEGAAHGPAGLLMQDPQATLAVLEDAAVDVRETGAATDGTTTDDEPTPSPTPEDDGATDDTGTTDGTGTDDENGTDDTGTGTTDENGTDDTDTGTADETDTGTTDDTGTDDTDTTDTGTGTGDEPDYLVLLDLTEVEDTHAQFRAFAEQAGVEQLEVEVWVDAEERVEQVRYTVPTAGARIEDEDVTDGETPTPDADDGTEDDTTDGETPTPTPDADDNGTEDTGTGDAGTDDAGTDEPVDAEVEPQADLVVTVQYSDFGTEVDIETPAEEDVIDIDEEQLRRSFGQQAQTDNDDTGGTTDE